MAILKLKMAVGLATDGHHICDGHPNPEGALSSSSTPQVSNTRHSLQSTEMFGYAIFEVFQVFLFQSTSTLVSGSVATISKRF